MSAPELIAARFARCVELFRDPDAKQDQKVEFRALMGLLQETAVVLRDSGGRVVVNGAAVSGDVGPLLQRIELHNVSEIAIQQDPPANQIFELLRALADQPGGDDVPARLRAAGVDHVLVTIGELAPPAPAASPSPPAAPASAPERYQPADPMASVPGEANRRTRNLGTDGLLHGEAMRDLRSVPLAGIPLFTYDPPPPSAAVALPGSGDAPPAPPAPPAPAAPAGPATPAAPAAAGPAPPPIGAAAAAPAHQPAGRTAASRPADALARLERDPQTPTAGDLLAEIVRDVESAVKVNRPDQLLRLVVGAARCEQRVPEGAAMRRTYGVALRRIYTKPVLARLARIVTVPKDRDAAVEALRRAGANAVEVLLELLVAAPEMHERRALFDALSRMTEGTGQLVQMLDHPEWFVLRNAAELVGELGLEEAVPALARQLGHSDERVRKAVALALAKIGSRSAAEPLRRALRDKSLEVRMQVALGIGRKSSALGMPLVVALDEEKDEAVQRELILALGRIGSADAVQALIKVAQPSGRIFGRRPAALRAAAVEALRAAATPAAVGTLEGLTDDGDKQVKAAAQAALIDLRRKKPRA